MRRFLAAESAVISVEAVLVVPFMIWAILGVFTLADGFRTLHSNINSSYALADALSRRTDTVDAEDLAGLNTLHRILTHATAETDLRVTVIRQDADDDEPQLVSSMAAGSHGAMTEADLAELIDQIPDMGDGETLVILETWSQFQPLTSYMLDPMEFHSLVVTRPRFAPQLVLESA
ncbi:MAG: hypothetical protein D6811_05330 [Alphaproteobacteria bacterium]|nr:MAG: hypothetical protein D6811_05330 [Alphaproteobacteria bacterium]